LEIYIQNYVETWRWLHRNLRTNDAS